MIIVSTKVVFSYHYKQFLVKLLYLFDIESLISPDYYRNQGNRVRVLTLLCFLIMILAITKLN